MLQCSIFWSAVFSSLLFLPSCASRGPVDAEGRPKIVKLGTIDCDVVETTPVVFQGKLYRFEYVRSNYPANTTGDSHFRFVNIRTGRTTPPFAKGFHLGSAFVEGDILYAVGTTAWGGQRIEMCASRDFEHWDSWVALDLPGFEIFNTSVCKADDKYIMMFEIGKPVERAGEPFTAQFAESRDLKTWKLLPPECNYAKNRYTAPHCLRYLDGWYYDFYLEALENPRRYHQYVVRSRDLMHWEQSPHHPVLMPSPEDKKIANPALSADQQARIAAAENVNNSDIDFCEFRGRVIINYSWGNQLGTEFLAEAYYDGTLSQFLKAWFSPSRSVIKTANK